MAKKPAQAKKSKEKEQKLEKKPTLDVSEVKEPKKSGAGQIVIFSRVSFVEKLLFTKHLATMIKAGITVSEALRALEEQAKPGKFKNILGKVAADVENGRSFSSALKKHDKVFDSFYTSLIDVGEESGTLEENLEFLAKQLSKDYAVRKKIQGAMLYPGLVLVATTVMGGFISLGVLPQLVDFFEALNVELPLATKILLTFANFMKNYGVLFFLGMGALITGLYFLVQTRAVKPLWHAFILRVPLIGKLIAYGQLARFTRNFGILIKSGVPISRSLIVVSDTLSNLTFRKDLLSVEKQLSKGSTIGEELSSGKYPEYPPIVSRMIGVGEKTGRLDETLLYLGDFYEEEIDSVAKSLTTVLEPILLLGIGLVVGFVALAIISPIYELTGSIRR